MSLEPTSNVLAPVMPLSYQNTFYLPFGSLPRMFSCLAVLFDSFISEKVPSVVSHP